MEEDQIGNIKRNKNQRSRKRAGRGGIAKNKKEIDVTCTL